jgi:hypothetical protein
MKFNINFTDLESVVVFSNEDEDGWYGNERGASFEDISIEIDLTDLCKLTAENLEDLQTWVRKHAEIHMRAAIHRRAEQQRKYEEAREAQERQREEEKRKNKGKKPGHIYLIEAENGNFKIGKSKHLSSRINEFGVKLPIKTWLVHSFESNHYDQAELTLHERFADKRTHGEWFMLAPEDVEYIKGIQDGQL